MAARALEPEMDALRCFAFKNRIFHKIPHAVPINLLRVWVIDHFINWPTCVPASASIHTRWSLRLTLSIDRGIDIPYWFQIVITFELTIYLILLLCISLRLTRRHRRRRHHKSINEPTCHMCSLQTQLPFYTPLLESKKGNWLGSTMWTWSCQMKHVV